MTIAAFDLDDTLLQGDCDDAWGHHLAQSDLPTTDNLKDDIERFNRDYHAGTLNIDDYVACLMQPVMAMERAELTAMVEQFVEQTVMPMLRKHMRAIVELHRQAGHRLVVVTATNEIIARPVAAKLFNISDVLATEIVVDEAGRYSDKIKGIPTFQEGKTARLKEYAEQHNEDITQAWYYGDSLNDYPVMLNVKHPVAVAPAQNLRERAELHAWPVIEL